MFAYRATLRHPCPTPTTRCARRGLPEWCIRPVVRRCPLEDYLRMDHRGAAPSSDVCSKSVDAPIHGKESPWPRNVIAQASGAGSTRRRLPARVWFVLLASIAATGLFACAEDPPGVIMIENRSGSSVTVIVAWWTLIEDPVTEFGTTCLRAIDEHSESSTKVVVHWPVALESRGEWPQVGAIQRACNIYPTRFYWATVAELPAGEFVSFENSLYGDLGWGLLPSPAVVVYDAAWVPRHVAEVPRTPLAEDVSVVIPESAVFP